MSAERRVLLLGATGLVGGLALRHLLATDRIAETTALVRRPATETHPRLRERVVDFDGDLGDLGGHTDVLCALGTTIKKAGSQEAFRHVDHDIPLRVAKAARAAGARSFALVSSVGAAARSSNFYLRTKGELEEALRALGYPALHLLRPSILLGERKEDRPGERFGSVVAKATSGLLVGGLRRYRPIEAEDVARALVGTVLRDDEGVFAHEHDAIVALARSAG